MLSGKVACDIFNPNGTGEKIDKTQRVRFQ